LIAVRREGQLTRRVLLVDDDPETFETARRVVQEAKFDLRHASTGADGLSLARACIHHVALVDLQLPDISGIDLLRTFRREGLSLPCVIMTARGSVASAVQAMKLGAMDYVEKPLTDTHLLELVAGGAAGNVTDALKAHGEASVNLKEKVERTSWHVRETLRIVEAHFAETNLTLRSVAGQLAVSVEHLCRLLKRETGSGFTPHLHRARVREAKRLLTETNLPDWLPIPDTAGSPLQERVPTFADGFSAAVPRVTAE
jgi:FixJ family two-component response regulator